MGQRTVGRRRARRRPALTAWVALVLALALALVLAGGAAAPLEAGAAAAGGVRAPATVLAVNPATGTVTGYPVTAGGDVHPSVALASSSPALAAPHEDAFDASGDLWIANCGGHSVVEYSPTQLSHGGPEPAAVVIGSATGDLACPRGLAFDASGDLWVSSATAGAHATDLVELTPSQLAASGDPTPASTVVPDAGSLTGPSGLAFDGSGDLWVANRTGDDLVAFSPAQLAGGGAVPPEATVGSRATSLGGPTALAFDASGDLWVTDVAAHQLVELSPAQLTSGDPAPHTTLQAPGSDLTDPTAVVVDGSGDLWVTVRQPSPTELELTAAQVAGSGTLTRTPAVRIGSRTASLDAPRGAAFDASGDLWVVDSPTLVAGLVTELAAADLSTSGTVPPATVVTPLGAASLTVPDAAALDRSGDLWVADYGDDRLVELAAADLAGTGAPVPAVTVGATGAGLDGPAGLAFDAAGDLWVADRTGDSVVEYAPGLLVHSGDPSPTATLTGAHLDGPVGLAFDAAGDLWVADRTGDSVVEYAPAALRTGGAVAPTATLTSTRTALQGPAGLAFDAAGDLWVANAGGASLVEYPPAALRTGGALAPRLTVTSATTSLDGPDGLAFDAAGDLWVAAAGTSSVVDYRAATLAGQGSLHPSPVDVIAGGSTGLGDPSDVVVAAAAPAGPAPPKVSALFPSRGPAAGGSDVTVEGSGFTPQSSVDFGATPAGWVAYVSSTRLSATAPPGAGTVQVRVSTALGTSPPTGANRFTYLPGTGAGDGYREVAADGGVFAFGGASFHGSMGGRPLDAPVVGMAADPDTGGYWLVAADGGVFGFDAPFCGSMGGLPLDAPVVGMAATPDGRGYWLVAADGGVFGFGDARFWGSEGGTALDAPVVGMAATPDGLGYWLVASDGAVSAFGDALPFGSMHGSPLDAPVVGMAATPDGLGYWLVAADGGVFGFGDARFWGSEGGRALDAPVVGMAATPTGDGYWLVAADGAVSAFGDARPFGSMRGSPLDAPVVGMAATVPLPSTG